ncbi:HNH endonuclease [Desulfatibacillum alkenivorans DSM 16219]|jgi:5-methylcytosine-specific restriction endonuclease McrA|uniref:HNH endonuclease n=1 Tax=Desulfatibacillum alkenivorans DSM 16219 TaxID=1121393 RepID=A0A1M6RNY0_9BACT|nr:HNH endonuclease [Desulfatibacillum alkenivorans]SHK34134.1 HNH endonuclease [Desulfatibacillum alkenivorans DSM 16219]
MGKSRRNKRASHKEFMAFGGFDDGQDALKAEREKAREMRASQWWKRQLAKGVCHYCGREFKPSDLTMDHLVPVARGGKTTKGNVVCACKECNNQKKYLLPMEWEQYLESLDKDRTEKTEAGEDDSA